MDYKEVRKEQLNNLIIQYQDLLYIEEQKLIMAAQNSRGQKEAEQEIQRLKGVLRGYQDEMANLESNVNTQKVEEVKDPNIEDRRQSVHNPNINVDVNKNYTSTNGNGLHLNKEKMTTIFEDDFYDNKNKWWLGETENIIVKIEAGCYKMISKNPKGRIIWYDGKRLEIDSKKDFKIETAFALWKNVDNYGFGFVWGESRNQFYDFCLSANGYFTLGMTKDAQNWNEVHAWEYNRIINREQEFNFVQIEKTGNTCKFYVNEVLMLEKALPEMPAKFYEMGFVVYREMEIMVDRLEIYN